jgi:hypothetical protein
LTEFYPDMMPPPHFPPDPELIIEVKATLLDDAEALSLAFSEMCLLVDNLNEKVCEQWDS